MLPPCKDKQKHSKVNHPTSTAHSRNLQEFVCGVKKKNFKNRTVQESHEEHSHKDKLSCSKCDFKAETDQKLDTHNIISM